MAHTCIITRCHNVECGMDGLSCVRSSGPVIIKEYQAEYKRVLKISAVIHNQRSFREGIPHVPQIIQYIQKNRCPNRCARSTAYSPSVPSAEVRCIIQSMRLSGGLGHQMIIIMDHDHDCQHQHDNDGDSY